ncbi:MAG: M57 family metalloprotease, partial [Pseudomonadota bacterium]
MADDGLKDDTERQEEPSDSGGTSAASEATLQEMADFLETGYWNNSTGLRHNLGSTGHDPNNGTLYYNVSGFDPLTYGGGSDNDGVSEARAELIRAAFDVYGAVLGINFVETTSRDDSVVDFFFSDNSSGAYAGSTRYSDGTIYYSYINIAAGWSGGTSTYDDYTLQTVFHEIGHALGLGHQGPYNGSASYGSNAVYELDSWQATMMSYFSQTQNTAISADSEYLQTPMAVDWLALDSIYGQFGYGVSNAFTGNTTYGFNTTISKSESEIWNEYANYANRTASTIIDAGGIDTVDFSGYSANQKIDLTVQTADQTEQDSSDIGGRKGNLTLAVGTVIENAVGGSGNDELIGNAAENVFEGGGGNDTMLGLAGNDTFHGDGGTDTVVFLQAFGSYAFSLFQDAIEVTGEGIDMVYDTVESLQFDNISYTFDEIIDLFSNDETDDPVASDDTATVTEGGSLSLDVLSNDSGADDATLSVTEVNGQDISVGSTVALASGAEVMLLANGTLDYLQNDAFVQLSAGEQNIDSFSYTVSDTNGGSDEASVSVTVEGMSDPEPDPVPSSDPIGQSGAITINQKASDQWHSISFDTAITDAVVVMGPVTNNGGDPLTTRVRNVTADSFEVQIEEEEAGGTHPAETVGWIAIEAGAAPGLEARRTADQLDERVDAFTFAS